MEISSKRKLILTALTSEGQSGDESDSANSIKKNGTSKFVMNEADKNLLNQLSLYTDIELNNEYAGKKIEEYFSKFKSISEGLEKMYVCELCSRVFIKKEKLDLHTSTSELHKMNLVIRQNQINIESKQ